MKAFKKYWAIFQITLINSLAYPGELIGRSLMIIPFMWIFYQLWKVTYAASGSDVISGLSLRDVLWYLMLAETIELGRPPLGAYDLRKRQRRLHRLSAEQALRFSALSIQYNHGRDDLSRGNECLFGGAVIFWLVGAAGTSRGDPSSLCPRSSGHGFYISV